MMKKCLNSFVVLSIVICLFSGNIGVYAAYNYFSENIPFPATASAEDDTMYILMSWNTDDAVASATVNSNITGSYIKVFFPSGATVSVAKNLSWNNAYKLSGETAIAVHPTAAGLETLNADMECVIKTNEFPVSASLTSSIGSARGFGGSIRFYPCDANGSKLSSDEMCNALNIGQKTYSTSDTVDGAGPLFTLEEINVSGAETASLPTDSTVYVPLTVTGQTRYGMDAAREYSYYSGGSLQYKYRAYITAAQIVDSTGSEPAGVRVENISGDLYLVVSPDVYESVGTEASVPVSIALMGESISDGNAACSATKAGTHTVVLKRPSVTVNKSLTNLTGSFADSQYCRTELSGRLAPKTGYDLPASVTVKIGTETLSASDYKYDSSTGEISIPASLVTGTVKITASGVAHKWSSAYSGDDSHHWHNCLNTNCAITADSEKNGYATHLYNQTVTADNYKVSGATCTQGEFYYFSCVCGARGSETFESGSSLEHSYIYTAENNIITEKCVGGCNHTATAEIEADNAGYDGTPKEATVIYSDGWAGGELEIIYSENGNVNPGKVTARISKGGAEATAEYEISYAYIWTVDTDSGYFMSNNSKYAVIRFLFDVALSPIPQGKITESGIKYVSANNIGENVESLPFAGASAVGNKTTFYGDIINIGEDKAENTYYAVAYMVIDGKTYWSEPIGCSPDFGKLIEY